DALLAAHRRLLEEEEEQAAPTGPAAGAVPAPSLDDTALPPALSGFTGLARAGRLADLEERLRPWLPFLLRRAGLADDLDEPLARQFLAYVRRRVPEVQQRSFRELLPEG